MCFAWKVEIDVNSNDRIEASANTRTKTEGAHIYQSQSSNQQDLEEVNYDDETIRREFDMYSRNLFSSQQLSEITRSLNFFNFHPRLVNIQVFQRILNIMNNMVENQQEYEDILKILLELIRRSIEEQNDFCSLFFQEGYYSCINKFFIGYDDQYCIYDMSLAKYALNILTSISNTSSRYAKMLFQCGLCDDLSALFPILTTKPKSPNWENDHLDIFISLFNLIISLLHYPDIFVDKDTSSILLIPNIYLQIFQFILIDINRSQEISLALSFIRQCFICIKFFEAVNISKDALIDLFNNREIFHWIIELSFSENADDNYIKFNATDALIAISSNYDIFSISLLNEPTFRNFLINLNSSNEFDSNLLTNICVILRNLFACDDPRIIDFIFCEKIMSFIKYQMNSIYVIKFEAIFSFLNLVLFYKNQNQNSSLFLRKLESYLDENSDILCLLVDSLLIFNEESFLKSILPAFIVIINIGEQKIKRAQKNTYAKILNDCNLLENLDQLQQQNTNEDIDFYSNIEMIKSLMEQAMIFDRENKNSDY